MQKNQKEKTRYDLVGKYKFNSIFVKTLSFLLIYSSLLLLVLFFYNNYITRKNVEQRLEQRTLGILEKTQESIDRELQNLANQIEQLSKDEYIRAAMTAPNIKDSTRNYDIVYQLQTVRMVNDLVDEAFFYIPTDDTLFSSEGVAGAAGRYRANTRTGKLIELCRNMEAEAGTQKIGVIDGVQYLFLSAPVFYDRVLGVLAFQMDSRYLCTLIEGERSLQEESTIWAYDEKGEPVFSNYIEYPSGITPETVLRMEPSEYGQKSGKNQYYKVVSEKNGWQYLARTDSDLFQMEKNRIDGRFLLILFVLSVFCIVFSIYLSRSVYLPIYKLIGIAEHSDKEAASRPQNELELLEQSVSYTVMRNQEMKHFLQNVKPSMVSDIFRKLLMGHEIEKEKLDSAFTVLDAGFHTGQNYTLEMFSLLPETAEFSVLECNILLHRIEQEITEFAENKFLCSFVHMLGNSNMVLVMGVPPEISVKQISLWKEEIGQSVREVCRNYPVQCFTGTTKYLADITELYKIFINISRELNYKRYLQDEESGKQTAGTEPDRHYVCQMFLKIKEKIEAGEETEVRGLLNQTAAELLKQTGTYEERRKFASLWWEAAMEVLLPLNVFEKEELNTEQELFFEQLQDPALFSVQLETFNEKVIEGIKANSKKLKRRYVERAKQYIEEHYGDSDLSLSVISEFLGISQSYLSTQFKKETGMNFVEYLNRYRIEKSRLLLQMTEMTVEEVGFKTGFTSAKNFARVFKKYTDTSPGMYRDR